MKVLDEKGKLFGKVNLIDLLVILLLLLIVAALGWKLLGDRVSEAVANDGPTYEFQVLCPELTPEACDFAVEHVGDQLMASGAMLDGYVTACEIQPMLEVAPDGSLVENPQLSNLLVTVRAQVSEVENAIATGKQEIRVGKQYIVKTVLLEITGTITSVEEVEADA